MAAEQLVITDSGLGGLSVCGALERLLAERPAAGPLQITYVNAWPEEGAGYNDLPDMRARVEMFERALARLDAMRPDRIAIACNTLSILYEHTARSRAHAGPPVLGIVEIGVELFRHALAADPGGSLVLLGTKTTIESDVHRRRLIGAGVAAARVAAVPCHGLAGAIETEPAGERVSELIEACSARAAKAARDGRPLYLGLCCTHYTYVRDRLAEVLGRHAGRPVTILDPTFRMAEELWAHLALPARPEVLLPVAIEVISKVSLDAKRRGVAALLERAAPRTAAALLDYTHEPDLF